MSELELKIKEKKDYGPIFKEALDDLTQQLEKTNYSRNIIIKGSSNNYSLKQPYWSDLDISLQVTEVTEDVLKDMSKIYQEFKKKHPEIKLSLTAIDQNDNYKENPLHHHGIKPIAYNFELEKQTNILGFEEMRLQPNEDAIRLSSIYRYYEILYDLRKNNITNNICNSNFVNKGFHRIARFIRTQIEIIDPALVYKEGMIDEEKFVKKYKLEESVGDFFEKKKEAKENWQQIMFNSNIMEEYRTYLTNKIEEIHQSFLPTIKTIAKKYTR